MAATTDPRSFASGRYEVVCRLGAGGQKTVYIVRDTVLDRECALSLLDADELKPADVSRLRDEARALARMGAHPNVVAVFDCGDEAGRPYLVCEYVRGGDLAAALARGGGRMPLPEALRAAGQVLGALAAVHARGIVHRDLKPENVWLTDEGAVKLGDFGLALTAERPRATETGAVVGTPSYMAPEQLEGKPVDARADLYAFGCLLYALVAGRPPYVGPVVSVISQHLHAAPAPPSAYEPEVPEALDALVLALLAKSPDGRPASAAACIEALEPIARSLDVSLAIPVVTSPPPAPPSSSPPLDATGREATLEGPPSLPASAPSPSPAATVAPREPAPRGRRAWVAFAAAAAVSLLAATLAWRPRAGRAPLPTAARSAERRLAVLAVREEEQAVDGALGWALASRLIEEVDRYNEFRPVSPAGILSARRAVLGDLASVPDETQAAELARRLRADTVAALSVSPAGADALTVAVHVWAVDDPARGATGMRQRLRRDDLDGEGIARFAQSTLRVLSRHWNVARWTGDPMTADAAPMPMPFDAWRAFLDAEQHCMLGRYPRCEALAREGLARDPDNAVLHIQLACALSYQGRDAESEAEARRAMALRGRLSSRRDMLVADQGALWLEAEAARARDDASTVRDRARRMVAIDQQLHAVYGDPIGYLYEAAVHQYFLGDVPRARQVYAEARRAGPTFYPAWYEESQLLLGDGSYAAGRREAARLLWTYIRCHADPEIAAVARGDAARMHLEEPTERPSCR